MRSAGAGRGTSATREKVTTNVRSAAVFGIGYYIRTRTQGLERGLITLCVSIWRASDNMLDAFVGRLVGKET